MQTILARRQSELDTLGESNEVISFASERVAIQPAVQRGTSLPSKNLLAAPCADSNHALVGTMTRSQIYQDYEKAFSEATGLPVAFRAVESWQTPDLATPLCLGETAVPVRLGNRVIGFLETMTEDNRFEGGYFEAKTLSPKQQESIVKLLGIFAQHLSMLSNQVVVQRENSEPPMISRAKQYIQEHITEDLSLGQVAKAVNTSTFYFCKMFKKATGINFTDYLSRMRIEKSKNLLLNPNLRVSEIAFEVGFQSLTHFNRVFKKILGQSPTEYRMQLQAH